MKMAIVLDWIADYGGTERVIEQMLASYPDATVYALVDVLSDENRRFLQGRKVQTSFLHRIPFFRKYFRGYLPLMPFAIEQFNFDAYDIVVSSNHAVAKGLLTRCDQLHISYIHTPIRYAWDLHHEYLELHNRKRGIRSLLIRMVMHYIRIWDRLTADRVDLFVANSKYVSTRVRKTYSRPSVVIYPPVNIDAFPLERVKSDYYIAASRFVPYKRMDLVVEAFTKMPDRKLITIGEGPDLKRIAAKAGPNIEFLGFQPYEKLRQYLQKARAYVFAANEDFGISVVEAQACGTPVIAYGVGGATETVIDGVTGIHFPEQTADSLREAVGKFEAQMGDFDPGTIREHAERFGNERFRREFESLVGTAWDRFKSGQSLDALAIGQSGR